MNKHLVRILVPYLTQNSEFMALHRLNCYIKIIFKIPVNLYVFLFDGTKELFGNYSDLLMGKARIWKDEFP